MSQRDELIIKKALNLIEGANTKGLYLRVLGAIAFRLHCPKFGHLLGKARAITDIDLMAYNRQFGQIEKYLLENGYEMRVTSIASVAARRRIFYDKQNGFSIDIFLDRLEMCHDVDFKGRLERDYPTIPLAEMLLEKLQIVQINEKDVKDVIILLREHEIGDRDEETINAKYIAKLLANDWGFYYTATMNLNKIKDLLDHYKELVESDKKLIEDRIDRLLDIIEKEPKSLSWKMRAKIGAKKQWYRKVEEIQH
ncbi:MAG: hypothetical protein QXX51_06590 [Candidatus Bathyarchaeia archaeon]